MMKVLVRDAGLGDVLSELVMRIGNLECEEEFVRVGLVR